MTHNVTTPIVATLKRHDKQWIVSTRIYYPVLIIFLYYCLINFFTLLPGEAKYIGMLCV